MTIEQYYPDEAFSYKHRDEYPVPVRVDAGFRHFSYIRGYLVNHVAFVDDGSEPVITQELRDLYGDRGRGRAMPIEETALVQS